MHAERDYLVKQVTLRLREWCERRRLRLVDIDLRAGSHQAGDATHNKNVVKVCLSRIDGGAALSSSAFSDRGEDGVPKVAGVSEDTYKDYLN